ncbi:hypothetical protein Pint_23926 [Pistacia integerrima]|uniref:Uncharacterized protein n=1 Tax=Pistacia integerrima TaxID=434235 RepID=A0ACC0YPB2_9ROSI|nr:hypothetical protein Pint_23926 [Pistacia integerrima]
MSVTETNKAVCVTGASVEGCKGVFHTASPFSRNVTDPQEELINPAVKGTLNVLRSCAKVPSIKRVHLFVRSQRFVDMLIPRLWYALSKTLAEEAAWKFAQENGIDLFAINPGLVIGPFLQPTLCSSVEPILNLAKGWKDDRQCEPKYQVSMEKAKGLGIIFISWEITLRDTIKSLKEKHFLSF